MMTFDDGIRLELGKHFRFFDPRDRLEKHALLLSYDKQNAIFWMDNSPLPIARKFIRGRHRWDYEERRQGLDGQAGVSC